MNYLFTLIDQLVNILGGFLINFILSQYWTLDALGAFNATLSLIGITGVLLGFGLNVLIEKKGNSINTLKLKFFFICRLAVNLVVALFVLAWVVSSTFSSEIRFVIFVAVIYGLMMRQFAIVQSARYAQFRVQSSVKISVLLKVLPILILMGALIGFPSTMIYVLAFIIIIALCWTYLDKTAVTLWFKFPKLVLPKKQNFLLMFDALLEVITRRIDLLISATFLGLSETGIFSIILQFATIPWLIFVAINRLFLSTLRTKNKSERFAQTRHLLILLSLFSIFCGLIIFFTLKVENLINIEIFNILENYFTIFLFLMFCYLFEAGYRIIRSNYISVSDYSSVTYSNLFIVIVKVFLSLSLVSYIGIVAFGVSSIVAHLLPSFILYRRIERS